MSVGYFMRCVRNMFKQPFGASYFAYYIALDRTESDRSIKSKYINISPVAHRIMHLNVDRLSFL